MGRFVFDRELQEMVPAEVYYAEKGRKALAKFSTAVAMPYIASDIKPYQSPVTGKVIESRSARREDLARTGCREVDPSEFKPIYKNYEFCQKRRLPYMGADVPPPPSRDELAEYRWNKDQVKKAEAKAEAVRKAEAAKTTDPDLPKILRGNPKTAPLFENNTVKRNRASS